MKCLVTIEARPMGTIGGYDFEQVIVDDCSDKQQAIDSARVYLAQKGFDLRVVMQVIEVNTVSVRTTGLLVNGEAK